LRGNDEADPPHTSTAVPGRKGITAPTLWRRSLPSAAGERNGTQGHARDRLDILEIRADDRSIYFDVTHEAARTRADGSPETSPAEVMVRLNNCDSPSVPAQGTVVRDQAMPTTVMVALADLPDGELELTVRAFGSESNSFFRKEGRQLRVLAYDEREGYLRLEADPKRGFRAGSGIVQRPCPEDLVP
jgi:hypothetical protein